MNLPFEINRYADVRDYPDKPIPKFVVVNGVATVNPEWENAPFADTIIWEPSQPAQEAPKTQP